MHVERYGHGGEQLVLIHGFGTSSFLWRAVAPAIAAGGHTAYAVDLLGYGESDRPYDADYSLASQAEYLDRALSSMRVQRATIVGVDIGGGVAMRLAVTRAARVSRLVLINSVAFDEWPGKDIRAVQKGTARFALRVARGILGAAPLLTPVLRDSVSNAQHMPPRLVARYLAPYVGSEGVSHLLLLARSLHREDLEDLDLGTIRVPTLILWGEEDRWLDSGVPDRLQAEIPGSTLMKLTGVARLVPEEAPDLLGKLLLEFVVREGTTVA